jgi:hypothetical protein
LPVNEFPTHCPPASALAAFTLALPSLGSQ